MHRQKHPRATRGVRTSRSSKSLPGWKVLIRAPASGSAFLIRSVRYFTAVAQSETSRLHKRRRRNSIAVAVLRPGRNDIGGGNISSVPGRGILRAIEDCFGKGKFQHDLPLIVGDFQNGVE